DGDVRGSLHVESDPLDAGQPRLQPSDHLVRSDVTLIPGFERDEDATVVDRGGAAAGADRRTDRCDRWILQHRVDHGLLTLGHGRIGDVLRGLGQAEYQPGVLLGKKALGDHDVQISRQHDGTEHHHERNKAIPEHDLESGLIEMEQAIETPFGQAVQTSVPLAARFEQSSAHHRRKCQRNQQREDQGHAYGDRKFAKQQPDIAAHQKQRNEYGDERQRDRYDRETDLARAFQGSVQWRSPLLQMPYDILDDDDRIVDHEADGDRQRHQREVIESVAQLVEHRESADQRQRHGYGRDDG